MDLRTWLCAEPGRTAALAKFLTSRGPKEITLAQVHAWGQPPESHYLRPVPILHAPGIEEFTKGEVMRWDVRPKDWHLLWADLKAHPSAPKLETA